MNKEYKIKWSMPKNYNPTTVLQKLPSPISREMTEIYNYAVKEDGFYFIDNRVDDTVAGQALKLFVDEALLHTDEVAILKLS